MKTPSMVWALLLAGLPLATTAENALFSFESVKRLAAERAAQPYEARDLELPRGLRGLDYDELRDIRFDPREAVWRMERLPFQLQFFHRGGLRKERVSVHFTEGERVETIPFSKEAFDYEKVKIKGSLPDDLGFAGFRIHYPLNRPDYLDELIVFQGASYFRALGAGQHYGLSARGLALKVAPDGPEEFPDFVEFWVEKPDRSADSIRLYALLDSPSVAGAYAFLVKPGESTVVEVNASLHPRTRLASAALAPLTSMFWFGENSSSRFNDFRPEVHDSDGLLIHTAGDEWLWRPLANTGQHRFSAFAGDRPRGFGLLQRDRRFASYEDLEAHYQDRPSVWVEPTSDWGGGEIRLVELPTSTEYADNIVAYWAPREALEPGRPLEFSYRLHWYTESGARPPLARTLATRLGDVPHRPLARKFVVDFAGHPLLDKASGASEATGVEPVVSVGGGQLLGSISQRNEINGSWRVVLDVEPASPGQPVELRCFLRGNGQPLSETWTYLWMP